MHNIDLIHIIGFTLRQHPFRPDYWEVHSSSGKFIGNMSQKYTQAQRNSVVARAARNIMWRKGNG